MNAPELLVCERAGTHDLDALLAFEGEAARAPWSRTQLECAVSGDCRAVLLLCAYSRSHSGVRRELLAECAVQLVAQELEIHDLTVRAARRGQGLGRSLLRATLSWAAVQGARAAHLEVRAGNRPALALYRDAGFAPCGRRRGYYDRPAEDAVLMKLDLASGRERPSAQP